jgi:hypothetical protein
MIFRLAIISVLIVASPRLAPAASDLEPAEKYYSAAEIRGRVVDDETGQPLSGVAVAVTWGLWGDGGGCGMRMGWLVLADTVTTDEGEFAFPAWAQVPRPSESWLISDEPWLRFFKAGYRPLKRPNDHGQLEAHRTPHWNGKDFRLRKFPGSEEQYFAELWDLLAETEDIFFRTSCDWERLPRFVGAIFREARTLKDSGEPGAPDAELTWGGPARAHGCRSPNAVLGAAP